MAQTRTTSNSTATATSTPLLRIFQIAAALSALNVLYQFVTAGQLISGNNALAGHGAGAIVLHVLSGVAALAAVLLWRRGQTSRGLALLAVVVFIVTFIQAAIGDAGNLYVHVPLAMLLTGGVVWVLLGSLRATSR